MTESMPLVPPELAGRVYVTAPPGKLHKLNICCCCSVAKSGMTLCNSVYCSTPGFLVLHYLLDLHKFVCTESVIPSNLLILCHPLLLLLLAFSSIKVFSNELALHIRQPKYWSFSFSISPSNDYSGLISFRIIWFDLLNSPRDSQKSAPAPQFKSISSLSLSLLYGPTLTSVHDYWKNNGFDYKDFVGEVMPLLFNMLSRFVIAFLPRSKHLLISWLQSPSVVILEPKKIKSVTISMFSLFAMKSWDQRPWS